MSDIAMDRVDAETAVRKYLLYLEDPTKLRDENEVAIWVKAVDDAEDPLDKLGAIAKLHQVSSVDEEPLREGFVRHAKAWADEQGIPARAFSGLQVPDEVLRQAGFEVAYRRGRSRGRAGQGGLR